MQKRSSTESEIQLGNFEEHNIRSESHSRKIHFINIISKQRCATLSEKKVYQGVANFSSSLVSNSQNSKN